MNITALLLMLVLDTRVVSQRKSVGERFIYALNINDIVEYLGPEFSPRDLNMMVFNSNASISKTVWLCLSRKGSAPQVFRVNGSDGRISSTDCTQTLETRPVFVLDLEKLGRQHY